MTARHKRKNNGLLREYFPKGTDLSGNDQDYLDTVAFELNGRHRQTLDWLKPVEKANTIELRQLTHPPFENAQSTMGMNSPCISVDAQAPARSLLEYGAADAGRSQAATPEGSASQSPS